MRDLLLLAVLSVFSFEARATEARTVRDGERLSLKGTFSIENGSDNFDRSVRYQALKLNESIDIEHEGWRENNVQRLKLWLQAIASSYVFKVSR